ncbi:hypothetical protein D3C72_1410780 [compost metagenome]
MKTLTAAKTINASRQPQWFSSHCTSGMNTVLAKPPHSVNAVMPAREWPGPTRRATTANAGSYSVAACSAPMPPTST